MHEYKPQEVIGSDGETYVLCMCEQCETQIREQRQHRLSASIMTKLGINVDQFNSLYTQSTVGSYIGAEVISDIARRFGIPDTELEDESLGIALFEANILTMDEGQFLDDPEYSEQE